MSGRGAGSSVAIAAMLAVLAGGCAPALLWYGHDPSRENRWELHREDGQSWLESRPAAGRQRDDKASRRPLRRSGRYDEVLVRGLVFSPDGRRFAVPARRGERFHMLVDLEEGRAWDGLGTARFDATGEHLAYPVRDGDRWRVVRDGRPGPALSDLVEDSLTFGASGGRLGHAVIEGGCVRLYIEDRPFGPACAQGLRQLHVGVSSADDVALVDLDATPVLVRATTRTPLPGLRGLTISPTGNRWAAVLRRGPIEQLLLEGQPVAEGDEIGAVSFTPGGELAYGLRQGGQWRFIYGGRSRGPFSWLHPAVFAQDGRHHAYLGGGDSGQTLVVLDGAPRGVWAAAEGLVLSPDGKRLAHAARRGRESGVVCDSRFYPFDVVVESSLTFSADSRHWAALVGELSSRRLWIVIDGARAHRFDAEELFGAAAQGAADLGVLRGWVAAELDHHLAARGRGSL